MIPSSFELGGRSWTVTIDRLDEGVWGTTSIDEAKIIISPDCEGELLAHTFYHELCHAIAFTLGWDSFNEEEGKIDALANILMQYAKTRRSRPQQLPSSNPL